jgi:hypothetical protein
MVLEATAKADYMNEPEEVEVDVQFISDDDFEAKDWPEYGAPITPEYSEEDFQKEFSGIVENLEKALLAEGWKRGPLKPHDDYDVSMDCSHVHRSLDIGILSDRMVCPLLFPALLEFLHRQRERWMFAISDERWSPDTGCNIYFKIVVEPDMIWVVVHDDDIPRKLGISA